jgi:DNA primase
VEREDDGSGRGKRQYDRYRHRLMFPIWDYRGQVIAFGGRALEGGNTGNPDAKYINSPEGTLFNKSRILYAWHLARPEVGRRESVIITEGYMDAIALHEAGFGNTIANTRNSAHHAARRGAGAHRTQNRLPLLRWDSAGMRAALRSAPLFATHDLSVRVVALPREDDPRYIHSQARRESASTTPCARPSCCRAIASRWRSTASIWGKVAERMEAIAAAADVISEVQNDIEKDDYIAWLAERWGTG